jgi:hypothetical protein
MRIRLQILSAAILSIAMAGAAQAGDVSLDAEQDKNALTSAVANRIVGLWRANVALGPCGGAATTISFTAFNTFHAGGTLSDSNARPGTERSPGHGVWKHHGRGLYETRFQFFRFLPNGALDGVQDIVQDVMLDQRGRSYETTVRAKVLNVDGSVRAELCGTAVAQRVAIE